MQLLGCLRLARILDISLDYLVGNTQLELDGDTLRRIEAISALSDEEKNKIFMVVDALIRDFNLRDLVQA